MHLPFTILLVYINIGAVLLAALYHTILYLHRRNGLLKYYCFYLWVCFSYLTFRGFIGNNRQGLKIGGLVLASDETGQMATFLAYILFLAYALNINKSDKPFTKKFVRSAPWVISAYIVWATIEANWPHPPIFLLFYITIRVFLLVLGFVALMYSLRQRPSLFYRYLAAGGSVIIFFGLVATLVQMFAHKGIWGIRAFSWLQFGYFFDVVFFSAAVGYQFKLEAVEKEQALKTILLQQQELKKNELGKIEAEFQVREQERLRISKDLHDDLGSSLSSIQLFIDVVEKLFDTNPGKAKNILAYVKQNAQAASENMGDLVWALNIGNASCGSFEERLKNYCYQLLAPKDISCLVEIPQAFYTAVTNVNVLRNLMMVTKECLDNTAKYSGATHAEVMAVLTRQQLLLRITDDGAGFEESSIRTGNGLHNMRQRVVTLGGQLIVKTAIGQGTVIGIILPRNRL